MHAHSQGSRTEHAAQRAKSAFHDCSHGEADSARCAACSILDPCECACMYRINGACIGQTVYTNACMDRTNGELRWVAHTCCLTRCSKVFACMHRFVLNMSSMCEYMLADAYCPSPYHPLLPTLPPISLSIFLSPLLLPSFLSWFAGAASTSRGVCLAWQEKRDGAARCSIVQRPCHHNWHCCWRHFSRRLMMLVFLCTYTHNIDGWRRWFTLGI